MVEFQNLTLVALTAKKFAVEKWPKRRLAAPSANNSAVVKFQNLPLVAFTAKKFAAERLSKIRLAAPSAKNCAVVEFQNLPLVVLGAKTFAAERWPKKLNLARLVKQNYAFISRVITETRRIL